MSNIRKRITAVLCATALALTGMITVGAVAANAKPSMGTGIVDIKTTWSYSYCVAHGYSSGSCGSYGTGLVIANQWSENEVITNYHVVQGATTGNSISIKDPFTGHTDFGYVQHTDPSSDLAVIWIYKSYNNGFTASDYTWTPVPVTSATDNLTPNGTSVVSEGDGLGDSYINNNNFHTTYGVITEADHYKQVCLRAYDGVYENLYHTVVTNTAIQAGDSGGALINNNFLDSNYQRVIAMNACGDSTGTNSIPIHWAIYDMLNTHP